MAGGAGLAGSEAWWEVWGSHFCFFSLGGWGLGSCVAQPHDSASSALSRVFVDSRYEDRGGILAGGCLCRQRGAGCPYACQPRRTSGSASLHEAT